MLNIVLFGPPGAGKGTQSKMLTDKYQLIHLSTGDIFRANLQNDTELGLLARSYMDAGQLVPDDITIQMLEAEVTKHPLAKGFIFDGFPRTINQAQALDNLMTKKNTKVTMMLALEVDEQELKTRLLLRGQESGRADDKNPEIIQNRIDVYNNETAPVKEYYTNQGKYHGVYGIGQIEDIFASLCSVIDAATNGKAIYARSYEKVAENNGNNQKNTEIIEVEEVDVIDSKQEEKPVINQSIVIEKMVVVNQVKDDAPKKVTASKIKKAAKPKKSSKKVATKKAKVKKSKPAAKPARPAGGKAKVVAKKVKKKSAPKKATKNKANKKASKKIAKKQVKKVVKKPARPAGGNSKKIAPKKTKKVASKTKAKKVKTAKGKKPKAKKIAKKKK